MPEVCRNAASSVARTSPVASVNTINAPTHTGTVSHAVMDGRAHNRAMVPTAAAAARMTSKSPLRSITPRGSNHRNATNIRTSVDPNADAQADATIAEVNLAYGALQPIDRQMTEITFDVIAETMLAGAEGARGSGLERTNGDYMRPLAWPLLWAVLRLPRSLPFPGKRRHVAAERAMREAVSGIVRTRRGEGSRSDLLQRLLQARDPESDQLMNDRQVTDNLLTFLLAGHETTARSLAWALYLLSLSPKWEALLLAEVQAAVGDAELTGAHVERLPLVTAFMKETMRLYPPISSISRIAARDVELGGKTVAKGSLVIIPMFAIHRHRKLWSDPDRFDPARFRPRRGGEARALPVHAVRRRPPHLHRRLFLDDRVGGDARKLRARRTFRHAGRQKVYPCFGNRASAPIPISSSTSAFATGSPASTGRGRAKGCASLVTTAAAQLHCLRSSLLGEERPDRHEQGPDDRH